MSQPYNITISVPSGNPDKLRVIEKTNRLSQALVFNRSELPELAKSRKELTYTGVYILVNNSGDTLPELYIGEGENVLDRLKGHAKEDKKDFWEWAVVIINRDNSLHKSHIQFIEAELIARASSNKRCILDNSKQQNKPSIPESVLFEAQDLLNDVYQIVPLLGISAFEVIEQQASDSEADTLIIKTKGIEAKGMQSSGKIVVKARSQAVKECVASISNGFRILREHLVKEGVLSDQGKFYRFEEDYTFESPSTAAAVVMGRNANGRTEWRTLDGTKLKELQDSYSN